MKTLKGISAFVAALLGAGALCLPAKALSLLNGQTPCAVGSSDCNFEPPGPDTFHFIPSALGGTSLTLPPLSVSSSGADLYVFVGINPSLNFGKLAVQIDGPKGDDTYIVERPNNYRSGEDGEEFVLQNEGTYDVTITVRDSKWLNGKNGPYGQPPEPFVGIDFVSPASTTYPGDPLDTRKFGPILSSSIPIQLVGKDITLTPDRVTVTPLPPTWLMMFTGLGALALLKLAQEAKGSGRYRL